jgi:hypothetical protein
MAPDPESFIGLVRDDRCPSVAMSSDLGLNSPLIGEGLLTPLQRLTAGLLFAFLPFAFKSDPLTLKNRSTF